MPYPSFSPDPLFVQGSLLFPHYTFNCIVQQNWFRLRESGKEGSWFQKEAEVRKCVSVGVHVTKSPEAIMKTPQYWRCQYCEVSAEESSGHEVELVWNCALQLADLKAWSYTGSLEPNKFHQELQTQPLCCRICCFP